MSLCKCVAAASTIPVSVRELLGPAWWIHFTIYIKLNAVGACWWMWKAFFCFMMWLQNPHSRNYFHSVRFSSFFFLQMYHLLNKLDFSMSLVSNLHLINKEKRQPSKRICKVAKVTNLFFFFGFCISLDGELICWISDQRSVFKVAERNKP